MSAKAHTPYIGLVRRTAALLLDLALLAFLSSLLGWVLIQHYPDAEAVARSLGALLVPFSLPVLILLWWRFQGAPGALLLGQRIVDARSGGRPRLWQALVRLLGCVLAALPLGLGFFWMLWDTRRQGWHDKLARTLVVEDDDSRLTLEQLAEAHR